MSDCGKSAADEESEKVEEYRSSLNDQREGEDRVVEKATISVPPKRSLPNIRTVACWADCAPLITNTLHLDTFLTAAAWHVP